MDFFEAQARAKKRTSRLLALFALAVAGTILAAYFAAVFGFVIAHGDRSGAYSISGHEPLRLWRPVVFGWVSAGTLLVVGLASAYKWRQYAAGGGAVAENLGGRRVDPRTTDLQERRLLNVVEEMAIASGTPVPAVYVLNDEAGINAFAAGLTTSDAAVAVTAGALQKLTRDELQGVIGHEFSHILNGDMRLNVRIAAAVFGILVLGLAGRGILWGLRHSRTRSRGRGSGGVTAAIVLVGLALLVIGYVGYFFGRLIQAAVSRQREFLADAAAVQFTRNPAGLVGALKKIGGYAVGSMMSSNKSGQIGHFFFAQAFRSGIAGWWSTHPPLNERIRALDPQFDGQYFEPPTVVDVERESFVTAGLVQPRAATGSTGRSDPQGQPIVGASTPTLPVPAAAAAVASVGQLTPERITAAEALLASIPLRLREAAHDAAEAPALVCGLLLGHDPATRSRQRNLVAFHLGHFAVRTLDELEPELGRLGDAQKLPLLQVAAPALRGLQAEVLTAFVDTLDALVHADQHVSTFEFALQKVLVHTLALGRTPGAAIVEYHSFNAVTKEIAVVLSALARAATSDPSFAPQAFGAGARQLKLIETRLGLVDAAAANLEALDAALDKLARASGPIKQRLLVASAEVVTADGQLLVAEAELLRAVSAALDCPMPPLPLSPAA